jgi:hypothetical protein
MKAAFGGGKIKSFSKVVKKESMDVIKKEENTTDPLVQIDYDEDYEHDEAHSEDNREHTPNHIIIEPYEEDESYSNPMPSDPAIYSAAKFHKHQQHQSNATSTPMQQTNSKPQTLLTSNELFLQSLCSSLDRLSDEKNMRARIKIQEILYQILYETP